MASKFKRADIYQLALIALGVATVAMLGHFVYKEIFPEYRVYQDNYIALEEFRSSYTGEPPPAFVPGVKQIVFERTDNGPAKVDRCTSCHVAQQLPHFSPTKIAYDVNGNIERTPDGTPIQIENENYVWAKLNKKIVDLRDEKVNAQLAEQGETAQLRAREKEANRLEALKTTKVGDQVYSVEKALQMHPLIGKETRPFQSHPIDEYGCTSCHSGNGRALTIQKAHGPVFDGTYEEEYMGPTPEFNEYDEKNDPRFADVYNHKPSDALLFQINPLLVGNLIQASCVQCHDQSTVALQDLSYSIGSLTSKHKKNSDLIKQGFEDEKTSLVTLMQLYQFIGKEGLEKTQEMLKKEISSPLTSPKMRERLNAQLSFLNKQKNAQTANQEIQTLTSQMLGSEALFQQFTKEFETAHDSSDFIDNFLATHIHDNQATGSLFKKWELVNLDDALIEHIEDTQQSFAKTAADHAAVSTMFSDVDWLTKNYQRGKQLFISQACYACHRIAGTARGGVGPDLTKSGENYPWYIKEKIVWPQGDLKTSTMPNMRLDSVELEDLMTYLLSQKGPTKTVSETEYKIAIQSWEEGRKMPWEKPIPPSDIHDVHYAMTVFATEGCAACHRLQGFQSNVGFTIEKQAEPSFDALYAEKQWFQKLFPEEVRGSSIVKTIEQHSAEIDKRISADVRKNSLLEEIDEKYPDDIESFYANFRFASRAKNHFYKELAAQTNDPQKKKEILAKLDDWKERVHRILMMYIQEYGLGRLIGPRPNWSGVYRSDEWLMEHFRNPSGHVPRSIMPILPFDDSKFLALTHMLDVLGRRNRDQVLSIWEHQGFDPEKAAHIYCSQCHGEFLQGNGAVATWIYPIPKNLRNAEFLRNLTKEKALESIMHGIKGTPMPPWSETPDDKKDADNIPVISYDQASKIVDWIFSSLPGATVIKGAKDVPKWQYTPDEVIQELKREGGKLTPGKTPEEKQAPTPSSNVHAAGDYMPVWDASRLYAALEPTLPKKNSLSAEASAVFEEQPNSIPYGEKYNYYIKKEYYTPDNIEAGRRYFILNCAVCHGNEGDGSGNRAGIMLDAKPRMLTNLDWLNTRDDLRLLRSIKYGVPGTAMTPWGDLTTSLQRMQLVIFIRSLTLDKERREHLATALYKAFVTSNIEIEQERAAKYPFIEKTERKYAELQNQRKVVSESDDEAIKVATSLYEDQLKLKKQLKYYQEADQLLQQLLKLNAQKREFYQSLGFDMISANVDDTLWQYLIDMINLNSDSFTFSEGTLIAQNQAEKFSSIEKIVQKADRLIENKKNEFQKQKDSLEKASADVESLHSIQAQITAYSKLQNRLLSGWEEQKQLQKNEERVYREYQKKIDTVNQEQK